MSFLEKELQEKKDRYFMQLCVSRGEKKAPKKAGRNLAYFHFSSAQNGNRMLSIYKVDKKKTLSPVAPDHAQLHDSIAIKGLSGSWKELGTADAAGNLGNYDKPSLGQAPQLATSTHGPGGFWGQCVTTPKKKMRRFGSQGDMHVSRKNA